MDEKTKQRIEEIRKRLNEYREHKNDKHFYDPAEIKAIRELQTHAPEDIEFLLNFIDSLQQKIELLELERFQKERESPFKKS